MLFDFTYYNPTRVHFGKDSLSQLKGELASYGETVLLMYGKNSIKKIGLYLLRSLEQQKRCYRLLQTLLY